jgi:hypothetical protein
MSETTTDPAPEPIAAPDPVVEATVTETTQAAADPEPETPEPEPTPEPKPRRADRHVANLTARLAAKDAEVQAAERRAQAAEALLQAGRGDDTEPPPPRQQQPDVETRATQIAAEREFQRRLSDIDAAGTKDLGKDAWEEAKSVLTGLGATSNQAFLEALAETANPAKVFAALADDSDELVALLRKSPAALAAQLGRIDARMETTTTKAVSNAPKPPARIQATAVEAEPNLYDDKISMRDWLALREKSAPRSLGGRR